MSKSNLTKNNFNPFEKKIFKGDKLDFLDLLKKTPLIPSIYFNKNNSNNTIIDTYFTLSLLFDKLENIKQKILFILETSKDDLENMKFSMDSYKLSLNNLLITITNRPNKDFEKYFKNQNDFKKFIDEFTKNDNFQIFKDNGNFQKSLNFLYVFQNVFNESSSKKQYFLSLFKLYINTRIKLIDLIKSNYGILAFSSFFNIKIDKPEKKKENIKKDTINYNKYQFVSNAVNEDYNNKIDNKGNKKIKYNLDTKISENNLLYSSNFFNIETYKELHLKKINELFNKFHDSLLSFVGYKSRNNLYNLSYYNIETDFYLLKFIFNYVSTDLFNKCIDINFKIKAKINKSINIFDIYYEQYINWWKELNGLSLNESNNSDNILHYISFDNFLEKKIKNIFTPNSPNNNDNNNGGNNSESESSKSGSSSKSLSLISNNNSENSKSISSIFSKSFSSKTKNDEENNNSSLSSKSTIKKSKQSNKLMIISTVYQPGENYGNFTKMIQSPPYTPKQLFIFNDNIEYMNTADPGGGNAAIRIYNQFSTYNPPRSAGIPTGSLQKGGFTSLDQIVRGETAKYYIDIAIERIKKLIEDYNYTTIYFSGTKNSSNPENNGVDLGQSIFKVAEDVRKYILEQIYSLKNI